MFRFLRRHPLISTLIVSGVLVSWLSWRHYRYWYPYGWSHCCDLCLSSAIYGYAERNGGKYPTGGATPEGSLGLLYPDDISAEILRGKTVPVEVVETALSRGEQLGPTTCGWDYVEGLTIRDNPRLALFWDKAGLGHNGRRLTDGGHEVFFVGLMNREYIPGDKWPAFLEEQARLHAELRRSGRTIRSTAIPVR
jgi:hypothetical protein